MATRTSDNLQMVLGTNQFIWHLRIWVNSERVENLCIDNDTYIIYMLRIDASNDGKSLSVGKHWINDRPMTEPMQRFNTRN